MNRDTTERDEIIRRIAACHGLFRFIPTINQEVRAVADEEYAVGYHDGRVSAIKFMAQEDIFYAHMMVEAWDIIWDTAWEDYL